PALARARLIVPPSVGAAAPPYGRPRPPWRRYSGAGPWRLEEDEPRRHGVTVSHPTVIPAEAGIQGLPGSVGSSPVQAKACPPVRARGRLSRKQGGWLWTPAFAGVTKGLLGDLV